MEKQEILIRIKAILIFLAIVLITVIGTAVLCAAQNAYVYTISKDGLSTEKQIKVDVKSENEVHFWTSKKNVEMFFRVGKEFDGTEMWVDINNKRIRCVEKDGLRIFAVTDKKAFYYRTTPKKMQQI